MKGKENFVCKLCRRDLSEFVPAFSNPFELKHIHTFAHFKELMRDMKTVCEKAATTGWVSRDNVDLAQDIMLRIEVLEGGLF